MSPVAMYRGTTEFEDGDTVEWRARERPHVMQDADKVITHLSNGVGDPNPPQCDEGNTGCPNHDHTFTLIQPVRTPAVVAKGGGRILGTCTLKPVRTRFPYCTRNWQPAFVAIMSFAGL